MHSSISPKTVIIAGVISFIALATIGYVFLRDYNVSIQKKSPEGVACTMEAKICPDGSAVGRVPPSCEFAACPEGQTVNPTRSMEIPTSSPQTEGGEGTRGGTSTISSAPMYPGESPMSKIPDLAIKSMPEPAPPFDVKYVVEHRSALNDKKIQIEGIVVSNFLKDTSCPDPKMGCPAMYMAPGITLAGSKNQSRNILYDLRVIMTEADRSKSEDYRVGSKVTIFGTVSGNVDGITVTTQ